MSDQLIKEVKRQNPGVVINQVQLFETLEKRCVQQKIKIEKLFLVIPSPNGYEGDTRLGTPYGSLLVFFVRDAPKALLLHRDKYKYPEVSRIVKPKTSLAIN